ncbi:hypothetical protein [Yinghuangia soli]|uniref:Uncharacterized protein n=1 Tax=Yinghuangia soli TaxID=2908204 RepID=A0AA41U1H3_9ACTN|nr:hypothetical protein [Yinghuangia soli]MCF2530788.1 hypothetical protein [Yinghuangia soli]
MSTGWLSRNPGAADGLRPLGGAVIAHRSPENAPMTPPLAEPPGHAAYFAVGAFPRFLADDAHAVASAMPPPEHAPAEPFVVDVQGETVAIPYRLYCDEPDAALQASFSERQAIILHCLYTRHHDGRVRQRHLAHVLPVVEPWVVPFVVQLLGEYVVQIQSAVQDGLGGLDTPGTPQHDVYGSVLAANREFLHLTRQRAASYWDCYYRGRYPWEHYPGRIVLESLRAAARRAPRGRLR